MPGAVDVTCRDQAEHRYTARVHAASRSFAFGSGALTMETALFALRRPSGMPVAATRRRYQVPAAVVAGRRPLREFIELRTNYFALKKSGVAIRHIWPLTCDDDPEPLG